jgi:hypothetical protein
MTESTALATTEDVGGRPLSEVVAEGANLLPEVWREARIAAARMLLPEGFRDPGSMIAFLARAQRSGLDPFLGELHAWKNEHGKLQFMTGRDGWLRLAREDERIEHVEHGLVYEGDEFSMTRSGRRVEIEHTGGIKTTPMAVMAYAVCHFGDGSSGEPERRTFDDYKHLLNKANWKQDPNGMLLTRAVANAVKFSSPAAAGIGSPADVGDIGGEGAASGVLEGLTERRTDSLRQRLEAARAPGEVKDETPIDVEGEDVTEKEPEEPATEKPAKEWLCDVCGCERGVPGAGFDKPQGLSGHKRTHAKERREAEKAAAEEEPDPDFHLRDVNHNLDGYIAKVDDDDPLKLIVIDPDGVQLDGTFDTLEEVETAANDHLAVLEHFDTLEEVETAANDHLAVLEQELERDMEHPEPSPVAASVAGTEHPQGEETEHPPIKLTAIYSAAEEKGLPDTAIDEILQEERWSHVFGEYRRQDAERINVFDLDQSGREDLLRIISES